MDSDLFEGSFWISKKRNSEDAAYISHDAVVVVLLHEGKVYYTKQTGFVNMGLINGTLNFSYIYRLNEKTFVTKYRPFEGLTFWDYSSYDDNKRNNYSGYRAGHLLIELHSKMVEIDFLNQLWKGVKI